MTLPPTIIIGLQVLTFIEGIIKGSTSLVIPGIVKQTINDSQKSKTLLATLSSIRHSLAIIMGPLLGYVSDKWGYQYSLIVLFSAGSMPPLAIICHIKFNIGLAFWEVADVVAGAFQFFPISNAIFAEFGGKHQMVIAQAINSFTSSMFQMSAHIANQTIPFTLSLIGSMVAVVVVIIMRSEMQSQRSTESELESNVLVDKRAMFKTLAVSFFMNLASSISGSSLILVLKDKKIDDNQINWAYPMVGSFTAISVALVSIRYPSLLDQQCILPTTLWLSALEYIIITLAAPSVWALWIATICGKLGLLRYPAVSAQWSRNAAGNNNTGLCQGMLAMTNATAAILGPLFLVNWIASSYGDDIMLWAAASAHGIAIFLYFIPSSLHEDDTTNTNAHGLSQPLL